MLKGDSKLLKDVKMTLHSEDDFTPKMLSFL